MDSTGGFYWGLQLLQWQEKGPSNCRAMGQQVKQPGGEAAQADHMNELTGRIRRLAHRQVTTLPALVASVLSHGRFHIRSGAWLKAKVGPLKQNQSHSRLAKQGGVETWSYRRLVSCTPSINVDPRGFPLSVRFSGEIILLACSSLDPMLKTRAHYSHRLGQ